MIDFELIKGDIREQNVDVMVTAANQGLRSGGGVDGAIHSACGSGLLEECQSIGGCSTGKAKLTRSYELEAKGTPWIIHAVGPRYAGGMYFEADLLADAYRSALNITADYKNFYLDQCLDVLKGYIGHLDSDKQKPYIEEATGEVLTYCRNHPIKTIALPSISTGVFAYPLEEAAMIATRTIKSFCRNNDHLDKVILVCYDTTTYNTYKKYM